MDEAQKLLAHIREQTIRAEAVAAGRGNHSAEEQEEALRGIVEAMSEALGELAELVGVE